MYVLTVNNVNDALPLGVSTLVHNGKAVSPRGLLTLEMPCPVATVYRNPAKCVLFSPTRDANPFFHLFEAMWILAGSDSATFLAEFNKNILNYSDDGKTFHAAYGHRLRVHFKRDQITEVITLLNRDRDTRQAVLQIWDAEEDLNNGRTKDIPCNDMVFLKIRDNRLNMTVCCRSNDIIWGCYGANAVQFSVLLQYLAHATGAEVGTLTQISDSFHAYVENPQWAALTSNEAKFPDPYKNEVGVYPLVSDSAQFHKEIYNVVFSGTRYLEGNADFKEPFIRDVLRPMYLMWQRHRRWVEAHPDDKWRHKMGDITDLNLYTADLTDCDWLRAGYEWIKRREEEVK